MWKVPTERQDSNMETGSTTYLSAWDRQGKGTWVWRSASAETSGTEKLFSGVITEDLLIELSNVFFMKSDVTMRMRQAG